MKVSFLLTGRSENAKEKAVGVTGSMRGKCTGIQRGSLREGYREDQTG